MTPLPVLQALKLMTAPVPRRLSCVSPGNRTRDPEPPGIGGSISHRRTAWISLPFWDSDDAWAPSHLSDAFEALRHGYDFYCCDNARPGSFELFSENVDVLRNAGKKLAEKSVILDRDGPVRGFKRHELTDEVAVDYVSHTSTVVLRSEAVGDIRFDADLRNACEDRMFWMQVALAGARIAISWRCNVECGKGVNLFFDAYDWNSPGTIDRLGCQLLFAEKLKRQSRPSPRRMQFAETRARDTRRAYAFLFVRICFCDCGGRRSAFSGGSWASTRCCR